MDKDPMLNGALVFAGQFDRYRDMLRSAGRKAGTVCRCHTRKRGAYAEYVCDGRHWLLLREPKEEYTLQDFGRFAVTDKLRVTGKGWVLVIDGMPEGMALGSRVIGRDCFPFTVTGYGGLSGHRQKELILSPNGAVGTLVRVGDILQLMESTFFHPDDKELIDAVLKGFHKHMKRE